MQGWERLGTRPGPAGYLRVHTETFRLPDGSEADWDIFGGGRSVAVLALTESNQVVLARQFRPGPELVLDELPGGGVAEGEDVLDAAARELLEETGYAGRMELAGTSWLASASRTQRFVAVALDARRVAEPATDPGEFCDVVLLPLTEFRRHLRSGQLTDVDLGYLALDHLGLLSGGSISNRTGALAKPRLVLISGSPGSGKTTLGRRLADELSIPYLNKDRLYDGMMATSRADSARVNEASWALFWDQAEALLGAGVSLVAEQTLWRGSAEAQVAGRLLPLAEVVNVHCRCANALDRWEAKMATQPSRDPDGRRRLVEDTRRRRDEFTDPLELGCPVIEVDTTDGYRLALEELVAMITTAEEALA